MKNMNLIDTREFHGTNGQNSPDSMKGIPNVRTS
jgi:hypothetical protein